MKRVLIVDDDFLVRTYLKQMIAWEEPAFISSATRRTVARLWNFCNATARTF